MGSAKWTRKYASWLPEYQWGSMVYLETGIPESNIFYGLDLDTPREIFFQKRDAMSKLRAFDISQLAAAFVLICSGFTFALLAFIWEIKWSTKHCSFQVAFVCVRVFQLKKKMVSKQRRPLLDKELCIAFPNLLIARLDRVICISRKIVVSKNLNLPWLFFVFLFWWRWAI